MAYVENASIRGGVGDPVDPAYLMNNIVICGRFPGDDSESVEMNATPCENKIAVAGEVVDVEKRAPLVGGEAAGDLPSPPPRPADEQMVKNMKVLCQFISKVGPNFENKARMREVGNPKFSFLFGGEPGSDAAIGHVYFLWMKRQYQLEQQLPRDPEFSYSARRDEVAKVSAAVSDSDMDMEDDDSKPSRDKSADQRTTEPDRGRSGQLVLEGKLPSNKSCSGSSASMQHNKDGDNDSTFLEDLSPVRASPDAANNVVDNNLLTSLLPLGRSSNQIETGAYEKTKDVLRVYIKDGSPFRLIQEYTSDDSGEDEHKDLPGDSTRIGTSPAVSQITSGFNQAKEFDSNIEPKISSLIGRGFPTSLSPLSRPMKHEEDKYVVNIPKESCSRSSLRASPGDPGKKIADLGTAEQGFKSHKGKSGVLEPYQVDKLHQEEDAKQENVIMEVDEFGRLIRKGDSDTDSDGINYDGRRGKRGRNRSRSQSPQENIFRLRSRSPRKRGKRSHSRSWSPKRSRSKSPPAIRRSNEFGTRDRNQPPQCSNFIRGRCFRGAFCRFLHRDVGRHRSRQWESQESRKYSRNQYFRHDGSISGTRHQNKIRETEIEIEEYGDSLKDESKFQDEEACQEQSLDSTTTNKNEVCDVEAVSGTAVTGATHMGKDEDEINDEGPQEKNSQTQESEDIKTLQESPSYCHAEEESTPTLLQSSHSLVPDSLQIQPSPAGKCADETPQPHLGDVSLPNSCQTISVPDVISEPQNGSQVSLQVHPMSHHALAQTGQSTPLQNLTPVIQSNLSCSPFSQMYQSQSSVSQPYPSYHFPARQPCISSNDFQSTSSSALNFHFQPSQQPLPAPYRHMSPSLPPDTLRTTVDSQHSNENIMPPVTSYQSHSIPPNPAWSNLHQPLPSHAPGLPSRPGFNPESHTQLQMQQNAFPHRYDPASQPSAGPYPPAEPVIPQGLDLSSQPFRLAESLHHPPRTNVSTGMPLPLGIQQDLPFPKEERSLHPSILEGPRSMLGPQMDQNFHHQFFRSQEMRIPFHGHGTSLREDFPNLAKNFPYTEYQALDGQRPFGTSDPALQRYPSSFSGKSLPPLSSDTAVYKVPAPGYYNPSASTFEQTPMDLKYGSSIGGREIDTNYGSRYDSSFSSGQVSAVAPGSRLAASPSISRRPSEPLLPGNVGFNPNSASDPSTSRAYAHESSIRLLPAMQKQFVRESAAGHPYDPLFDSIETSSAMLDKVNQSNLHRPKGVEGRKRGMTADLKSEIEEFGEATTDAEAGVVENGSPHPGDGKEWSPAISSDTGNAAAGEIEIDQVPPGKSRKRKDSRSMKLFRIALADFVKEVLKPSWRQGNMSKEAFKTIVKKTVDKVSGAMGSHQIPKSQLKINQYVESSQRKLTKLVMGYVDKYVKV